MKQRTILGGIAVLIFLGIIGFSLGWFGKKSSISLPVLLVLVGIGAFLLARSIPGTGVTSFQDQA